MTAANFFHCVVVFTAEYKYLTADALLADVQLMIDNSRAFNGADSPFTKNAMKIYNVLLTALTHERKHFGIERDTIHILEEAIKKKYVHPYSTCILACIHPPIYDLFTTEYYVYRP